MALVLSRKAGQSIRIGDQICVTMTQIRGDKARLAITAPIEIPIHREEVYERIAENEREAAQKA